MNKEAERFLYSCRLWKRSQLIEKQRKNNPNYVEVNGVYTTFNKRPQSAKKSIAEINLMFGKNG